MANLEDDVLNNNTTSAIKDMLTIGSEDFQTEFGVTYLGDSMINSIFSYRKLFALAKIAEYMNRSNLHIIPVKSYTGSLIQELCIYYSNYSYKQIEEKIWNLKHTIIYQYMDICKIWADTDLFNNGNPPKSKMRSTHDMSSIAIYHYVHSMLELHNQTHFKWEIIKDIIKDKIVLDFGCGAGFFGIEFDKNMNAKEIYMLDKENILDIAGLDGLSYDSKNIMKVVSNLKSIPSKIEVLWLSEVIHSKIDPIEFMKKFEPYMADSAIVLINALKPYTSRSQFF